MQKECLLQSNNTSIILSASWESIYKYIFKILPCHLHVDALLVLSNSLSNVTLLVLSLCGPCPLSDTPTTQM